MQKKIIPILVIVICQFLSACAKISTPPATSARVPNSVDAAESPWTTWSKKGTVGGLIVLKGIRENLLENNLHDPHINYSGHKSVDCSKQNTKFRSADGTCNDIANPQVGAAGTAFGRNVAPALLLIILYTVDI